MIEKKFTTNHTNKHEQKRRVLPRSFTEYWNASHSSELRGEQEYFFENSAWAARYTPTTALT
jgi:hypothetical protein